MKTAKVSDQSTIEHVFADYLFASDFYHIKNWVYNVPANEGVSKGYNDCFCFAYVRKGNFLFNMSTAHYDMHTGHMVIDKPDYDYKLRPAAGECTIFNFTDNFYRQFVEEMSLRYAFFFSNPNLLALMLKATPQTDYLHHQIIKKIPFAGKLEIDNLVLELLHEIVSTITNQPIYSHIDQALKINHLGTIEKAKAFLAENFETDISLSQLADHCCVSPFHFSRIFKKFTSYSPNQYLLNLRLKHGEMLLKTTAMPIGEAAFLSGFNSAEYFATSFKQRYGVKPTEVRRLS
jgi:AraC-like DNA-binding protein